MRTLYFMTPTARPAILPATAASFHALFPHPQVRVRWLVDVAQPGEGQPPSFPARHERMLDSLPAEAEDVYFMFLADDTRVDPRLLHVWMAMPSSGVMWMFRQSHAVAERPAWGEELDNGQAIISLRAHRAAGVRYYAHGWERHYFRHLQSLWPTEVHLHDSECLTHHDLITRTLP